MDIRGKGVTFEKVRSIINQVSAEKWWDAVLIHDDAKPLGNNDYGFRGRIVACSSNAPCARRSWSGRRGPYACWHAYRDVMRAVLTEFPDAVITTAQARYEGLAGFERTYPSTANINIGSMVQHAYMPDLCNHGYMED